MVEEVKVEEEKPTEEKPRRTEEFDIMSLFKGGGMEELDPMTRWLLVQEMLDDWRDRREEKRGKKQTITPDVIASAVVKALNEAGVTSKKESDRDELMEKWEKRFMEFQSNIEKLLLGKKAEEAEEKAERFEKELKEYKQKEEHEKLLSEKIQEAIAPYKEQVAQLQELLADKTKNMSENERKGFFQKLGQEIENNISDEVTGTIAKNIASAIMGAFTPKEEPPPVTKEGKVDTVRLVDRWVRQALDVAGRYLKAKEGPPPPKPIQKIPIQTSSTASSPAEVTTTTAPPATTIPPPAETTTTTPAPATPTVTVPPPQVAVSTPPETPKQPPQEPKQPEQPKPEAKPEIPEQPKQEAKPETEEKPPERRAKPRKHSETASESPEQQKS